MKFEKEAMIFINISFDLVYTCEEQIYSLVRQHVNEDTSNDVFGIKSSLNQKIMILKFSNSREKLSVEMPILLLKLECPKYKLECKQSYKKKVFNYPIINKQLQNFYLFT